MRGKTLSPRLITFANLVHLTRGMFLCVRREISEGSPVKILHFQMAVSILSHSERKVAVRRSFHNLAISSLTFFPESENYLYNCENLRFERQKRPSKCYKSWSKCSFDCSTVSVRLKGIFEVVSSQISTSHTEPSHDATFLSAAETVISDALTHL